MQRTSNHVLVKRYVPKVCKESECWHNNHCESNMELIDKTHPTLAASYGSKPHGALFYADDIQKHTRDNIKIKEAVDTAMHEVELDAFHPSTKVHLETMRKRILHYLELK